MTTTEKLLTLADWLQHHVQDQDFDLTEWLQDCGTVGCAIGHAASCPDLAAQGLYMDGYFAYEPRFRNYRSWKAVEVFFGLRPKDAMTLFHEDAYNFDYLTTKQHAIDRIIQFASERSEDPKTTPESS